MSGFRVFRRGLTVHSGRKLPGKVRHQRGPRTVGTLKVVTASVGTVIGALFAYGVYSEDPNPFRAVSRVSYTFGSLAIVAADYKLVWWRFAPEHKDYEAQLSAAHSRAAQRVLALCEGNAGLYIKIGQYLASLAHALPPEYPTVLSALHRHSFTPMSLKQLKKMFREDLDAEYEDIFSEFEVVPVAGASLAQVHRAKLKSGEEVAVKVQYPQLRSDLRHDLHSLKIAFQMAAKIFPGFELDWVYDEMSQQLTKELDFEAEGGNAEKCAALFRDNPHIYVPKIFWENTSKRILVMEWIQGVSIQDAEAMRGIGLDEQTAVATTMRALADQIFIHGFVHTDPHPGNLLVRARPADKAGSWGSEVWKWVWSFGALGARPQSAAGRRTQVVLLDHGLYRELDDKLRQLYIKLFKALVYHRDDEARACAQQMGAGEDWDYFSVAVLTRSYKTLGRIEGEDKEERVRRHIARMCRTLQRLPRPLLLVLRAQNYMRALNAQHGSQINRFLLMARSASRGDARDRGMAVWRSWLRLEVHFLMVRIVSYFTHLLTPRKQPPLAHSLYPPNWHLV